MLPLKANFVNYILLLCLVSCKKPDTGATDCNDVPATTNSYGYKIETGPVGHQSASYNPLNNNQVVYMDVSYPSGEASVVIRDLSTGREVFLAVGCWYPPRWNKNGWIVFGRTGNQLWKVKSTGDSLTLLNADRNNTFPYWSPDGKKIVLMSDSVNGLYPFIYDVSTSQYHMINDDRTEILSWSPDGHRIAYSIDGSEPATLKIYDTVTHIATPIPITGTLNSDQGSCWTPDGNYVIWAGKTGLYKIDIAHRTVVQLRKGCSSRHYLFPSVSADGSTIMFTKIERSRIDKNTLSSTTRIWLMDINGNNERQLF